MKRAILSAGHLPTLIACFAYFDLSLAVWVLLGPLAVFIAQGLQLDPGQKGLIVAVPVLAGALLRVVNGVLVGQWNARRTGIVMQVVVILGLAAAWMFGIHSFGQLLVLGCVLGVAGASFAIALPMVSYWYPAEHQGTALGLAGLSPVHAGYFTAACVFAGSFARPFGGLIADRIGGTRALMAIYLIVAAILFVVAQSLLPTFGALAVIILGMIALGMGNGAVFQLVPQRFAADIGLMTGLVGMTGGIGGFALAASLGFAKQFTGTYGAGFTVFAILALAAWAGIAAVRIRWREDAAVLAGARI